MLSGSEFPHKYLSRGRVNFSRRCELYYIWKVPFTLVITMLGIWFRVSLECFRAVVAIQWSTLLLVLNWIWIFEVKIHGLYKRSHRNVRLSEVVLNSNLAYDGMTSDSILVPFLLQVQIKVFIELGHGSWSIAHLELKYSNFWILWLELEYA